MNLRIVTALFLTSTVFALILPVTIVAAEPLTPPEVKSMILFHSAKPSSSENSASPPLNNLYYELLGVKLTPTFTYFVNPKGSKLEAKKVENQIKLSFDGWNWTTEVRLFNYVGLTTKGYARDGQNTVLWKELDQKTKIAMTVIWYVPDTDGDGLAEIVEADIVLNSLLKWGIDPDGEGPRTIDKYDVKNIATHEAGHIVGLAGLTDGSCRELTMCEHSAIGQTNKISLEGGDVTGAQFLYGVRYSR